MSTRRFSSSLLYALRNQINVQGLIEKNLCIPCRVEKGCFRFLCPLCSGFDTAVNPKTNLARCFQCGKNYNTIDLVMLTRKLSFIDSVRFLQTLGQSRTQNPENLRVISAGNPNVDGPSQPNVPTSQSQPGLCHIGKTIDSILSPAHGDVPHKQAEAYEPGKPPADHQHTLQEHLAQFERQLANLGRQLQDLTRTINQDLPSK